MKRLVLSLMCIGAMMMPVYGSVGMTTGLSDLKVPSSYVAKTVAVCVKENVAHNIYRNTITENNPSRGGLYFVWAWVKQLCAHMSVMIPANEYRECRLRAARRCGALGIDALDNERYLIIFPSSYN